MTDYGLKEREAAEKAHAEELERQKIQQQAAQVCSTGTIGGYYGNGIVSATYRPRDPDELCRNECLTAAIQYFSPKTHSEAIEMARDFYDFMKHGSRSETKGDDNA